MGNWMPEGAEYHEGFVGEYPWATPFNLYKESFVSRFGADEHKLPCRVIPTCNSLSTSGDSFQSEGVGFHLPARRFFDDGLRWDGAGGYRSYDGRTRFLDPSVTEPGPGALLVDPAYLREFLAANDLV